MLSISRNKKSTTSPTKAGQERLENSILSPHKIGNKDRHNSNFISNPAGKRDQQRATILDVTGGDATVPTASTSSQRGTGAAAAPASASGGASVLEPIGQNSTLPGKSGVGRQSSSSESATCTTGSTPPSRFPSSVKKNLRLWNN